MSIFSKMKDAVEDKKDEENPKKDQFVLYINKVKVFETNSRDECDAEISKMLKYGAFSKPNQTLECHFDVGYSGRIAVRGPDVEPYTDYYDNYHEGHIGEILRYGGYAESGTEEILETGGDGRISYINPEIFSFWKNVEYINGRKERKDGFYSKALESLLAEAAESAKGIIADAIETGEMDLSKEKFEFAVDAGEKALCLTDKYATQKKIIASFKDSPEAIEAAKKMQKHDIEKQEAIIEIAKENEKVAITKWKKAKSAVDKVEQEVAHLVNEAAEKVKPMIHLAFFGDMETINALITYDGKKLSERAENTLKEVGLDPYKIFVPEPGAVFPDNSARQAAIETAFKAFNDYERKIYDPKNSPVRKEAEKILGIDMSDLMKENKNIFVDFAIMISPREAVIEKICKMRGIDELREKMKDADYEVYKAKDAKETEEYRKEHMENDLKQLEETSKEPAEKADEGNTEKKGKN